MVDSAEQTFEHQPVWPTLWLPLVKAAKNLLKQPWAISQSSGIRAIAPVCSAALFAASASGRRTGVDTLQVGCSQSSWWHTSGHHLGADKLL